MYKKRCTNLDLCLYVSKYTLFTDLESTPEFIFYIYVCATFESFVPLLKTKVAQTKTLILCGKMG